MKRLLLVRHGETEWNALRRLQGQTDIALSDHGRAQARALAPLVAAQAPDHARSSDLKRAAETAGLLGYGASQLDAGLREQSLGDWSGVEIADLLAATPELYKGWRAGSYTPPGGEEWPEFRARITTVAMAAVQACDSVALITCHGGVIRAALDGLLGLEPARVIPVGPASLTILALDGPLWRLEAFNVTGASPELNAPD